LKNKIILRLLNISFFRSVWGQIPDTGAVTIRVANPGIAVIAGWSITADNAGGLSGTEDTGEDVVCTFAHLPGTDIDPRAPQSQFVATSGHELPGSALKQEEPWV
jgi:hypothetical protein